MILIENLYKRFGRNEVLKGVDLNIPEGGIYAVLGPNGSGKTTLVRCVIGIFKPESGKVRFKGEDITGWRPWKVVQRGLVGTFQVVKPFRRLPVIANVMVGCCCPRITKGGEWTKTTAVKARDALEFVGIADRALEPASTLSHGDLKRLEVARAIATDPELLILDEPFGGLNPAETDLVAKSMKRLHKGGRFGRLHSEGPAMLIIEHKLSELMKIVDRVIVINFGEIIAQGTPEEIVKMPAVIEAYTGKEVLIA